MRLIFLGVVFILVALLGVLHIVGIEQELYWKLWWYDIPMHTLGGVVIASAYLWGGRYIRRFAGITLPSRYASVFFFTLAIGVAWEVFEYFVGLYPKDVHPALHELDTVMDIAFDMGGATIAYMSLYRLLPPPA